MTSIENFSFTIAIPLYNEEQGLDQLKVKLDEAIKKFSDKVDLKIFLIDDGSEDDTSKLLQEIFSETHFYIFTHEVNLNLGAFLNTAITNCDTEYIGFLDSDCTYEPEVLFEMLNKTDLGFDIINASPLHPDGKVDGLSRFRWSISFVANLIYRILVNKKIYTSSSICKIYKTSLIKDIQIQQNNFVAITELFLKTILFKKINHYEFPCELNTRKYGESKIKFLPTIKSHILLMIEVILIKIRFKKTVFKNQISNE